MRSLAIARLSVIETLRRKEFYVVLTLTIGLAIWISLLNIGNSSAARFAKDILMQVTWLASFGLAAPLAARQITSDVEQRTVYVLMSRPIHRWHYVFGRALGAAFAAVTCFTVLFLVLIGMLLARRASGLDDPALWQSYGCQVSALILFCALTVFFSTFSTSSAAVTYAFLLLVVTRYGGNLLADRIEAMSSANVLREFLWFGYFILPHFEFFNLSQRVVHGWGPLPFTLFGSVVGYGIVYAFLLIGLAATIFRRRWL